MKATVTSPFRAQLTTEIRRVRCLSSRDGITGFGIENLYNLLRLENVPDAPRGTNAGWRVKEEMHDILLGREFINFVL